MLFNKRLQIIFWGLLLSTLFVVNVSARNKHLAVKELDYQGEMHLSLYAGTKSVLRLSNFPGDVEVVQISKIGLESSRETRLLGKRSKEIEAGANGASVDFAVSIAEDSSGEVFKIKTFTNNGEGYDISETAKIIVDTFRCTTKKPVCGLVEHDCGDWKGASCPEPEFKTFESICELEKYQAKFSFEGSCD